MPNEKVLIAYGTRYGSTEEISQRIAELLESRGLATQLVDLKNTKERDLPTLGQFGGVLVGSGIKTGRWMKEPVGFLAKHKEELRKSGTVVGVFVSSGYASVPQKQREVKKEYIEEVMAELGIEPHLSAVFGAVLDFSPSSRLGFLDKQILRMAARGISEETGIKIQEDRRNDLRDWNQIQRFAEKYARLVESRTPSRKRSPR